MSAPVADDAHIRTEPRPDCYLCGAQGGVLYENLKDRLFGVPGEWTLKKCPNLECRLIWLDPMPLEEDIWKAYRTYYTHQSAAHGKSSGLKKLYQSVKEGYWASQYGYRKNATPRWKKLMGSLIHLEPGRRASLDFGVMYLPYLPNGKLLEVGCGSGDMLKTMQDLGWETEGVDFDPKAVEQARSKGLTVRLGTLEQQSHPDDYFDAVIMSHLIEHVHKPLEVLRECERILKPGGKLIVVTPNTKAYGHRRFSRFWLHLDPPRHLHIFTEASLESLAEKAKFSRITVSTIIRDANNTLVASHVIKQKGKYIFGGPQPAFLKLWAKGLQIFEWLVLQFSPYIGEELVLVAEK